MNKKVRDKHFLKNKKFKSNEIIFSYYYISKIYIIIRYSYYSEKHSITITLTFQRATKISNSIENTILDKRQILIELTVNNAPRIWSSSDFSSVHLHHHITSNYCKGNTLFQLFVYFNKLFIVLFFVCFWELIDLDALLTYFLKNLGNIHHYHLSYIGLL